MMSEVVLAVQDLSKTYESVDTNVRALQNVSLELNKGELLAIMGTSGSGKSTLLNILGALDKPDEGVVYVNGEVPNNMFVEPYATEYRRDNIGFIFQSFHLLKDLSVEENIALPLILSADSEAEIREKTNKILDVLGLVNWRNHRPVQLSGGQQQRVAIGRALITSPPIVLADEPTGNLDFNTSNDILRVLVDMKQRFNQSMILVTHDPHIATYADRVLFFHDGENVDDYTCTHGVNDMNIILDKFKKLLEKSK
ncbi:ABC transporter ATP-binding protein [Bacillus thuringiensis serovar israelensis]|uniref:ABC transporter ATP-binding protein n=4 Tax=Bacillus cereus group TaxID=86661 RepID=A0A2A8AL05_9BACI|nr:ABC transporter ATP-binding protein [Bacillus thuringiensis HD-789]AJH06330.1 ABC transporter family protein [Bacillus thuringiensis HD1002]EEN02278.1 ABC transporter ATP-binding protein [Bacillus thuringiensis IBL 4222]OTX59183.1 ABC transporter ATP-binding protein [Bacillus thuringiensis serovar novosibirsk]OTZ50440.1 ABC transporter ATP-binding protein [Bacillus thuringiensis serovar israelensis]PEJ07721.1 ABC transporter ATP-binding protein [Bacillus wiedmannii]RCX41014.1 putative ABC 